MQFRLWRLAPICCAVVLIACARAAHTSVAQLPDGRIVIEVTTPDGNPACVDSVSIGKEGGSRFPYYPYWTITRMPSGRCRSKFVYPQVPDGYYHFSAYPTSTYLDAGHLYEVKVSGEDFNDVQIFSRIQVTQHP